MIALWYYSGICCFTVVTGDAIYAMDVFFYERRRESGRAGEYISSTWPSHAAVGEARMLRDRLTSRLGDMSLGVRMMVSMLFV